MMVDSIFYGLDEANVCHIEGHFRMEFGRIYRKKSNDD